MWVLGFYPSLINQLYRLYLSKQLEIQHGQLSGDLRRTMVEKSCVWREVGRQLGREIVVRMWTFVVEIISLRDHTVPNGMLDSMWHFQGDFLCFHVRKVYESYHIATRVKLTLRGGVSTSPFLATGTVTIPLTTSNFCLSILYCCGLSCDTHVCMNCINSFCRCGLSEIVGVSSWGQGSGREQWGTEYWCYSLTSSHREILNIKLKLKH